MIHIFRQVRVKMINLKKQHYNLPIAIESLVSRLSTLACTKLDMEERWRYQLWFVPFFTFYIFFPNHISMEGFLPIYNSPFLSFGPYL